MEEFVVRVSGRLNEIPMSWFRTTFSTFGTVANIDRKEDEVRISYASLETAQAACREMDGETVSGSTLHVKLHPYPDTNKGDGEEGVSNLPRRFSFKLDSVETASTSTSNLHSTAMVSMVKLPQQHLGSHSLFQTPRHGLDLTSEHAAMRSSLLGKQFTVPDPIHDTSQPARLDDEKPSRSRSTSPCSVEIEGSKAVPGTKRKSPLPSTSPCSVEVEGSKAVPGTKRSSPRPPTSPCSVELEGSKAVPGTKRRSPRPPTSPCSVEIEGSKAVPGTKRRSPLPPTSPCSVELEGSKAVPGTKRKSPLPCPIETKKEGKFAVIYNTAWSGKESKEKEKPWLPISIPFRKESQVTKKLSPIKDYPRPSSGSQPEHSVPRTPHSLKQSKTQPLMLAEVGPLIEKTTEEKGKPQITFDHSALSSIDRSPTVRRTQTAPLATLPHLQQKGTVEIRSRVKSPSPSKPTTPKATTVDRPVSSKPLNTKDSDGSLAEDNNPFKRALERQKTPVIPAKRLPSPQPKVARKATATIVSKTIDCPDLMTKRIFFLRHRSTLNTLQKEHVVMVKGDDVEGSVLSITGEQKKVELVRNEMHALFADIKSRISWKTFTINCAFLPLLSNLDTVSLLQEIEKNLAVSFTIVTLDSQVGLSECRQSLKTKKEETSGPLSLSQVQGFVALRVGYFWKARNVKTGMEVGFAEMNEKINSAYIDQEMTHSFVYKSHRYVVDFSQMTVTDQTAGGEVHTLIREDPLWCRHVDDDFEFKPLRAGISTIIESIFQQGAPGLIAIEGKQCVIDFNSNPMVAYSTEGESCVIARRPELNMESDLIPVVTLRIKGLLESLPLAKSEFCRIVKERFITQKVEMPPKIWTSKVNQLLLCGIARQYCIQCNSEEKELGLSGERETVRDVHGLLLQETLKIMSESEALHHNDDGDAPNCYPLNWEKQSKEVQLFSVTKGGSEWSHIEKLMKQSLSTVRLTKVERIQNKNLWQKYIFFQRAIQRKMQGKDTNEKELFHGTKSNDPSVIYESEKGFDFRFGSSSCMWGQGSYFAVDARYSDSGYAYRISGDNKQLILAKVMTGESKFMDTPKKMNVPPLKPGSTKERYDSIKAKTGGSEIYVIYDHEKAYPAYLITYQT